MTTRIVVDEGIDGGARLVIEATFPSVDAMDQLLLMGFDEGLSSAVGQIDGVLHADPDPHERPR